MTPISFLLERFATQPENQALAWKDHTLSYGDLATSIAQVEKELDCEGIGNGMVVAIRGDYSFYTTTLLLALAGRRAITIPLLPSSLDPAPQLLDEVQPEVIVDALASPAVFRRRPAAPPNSYYRELMSRGAPGLVLFTSGSTGKPKAVIHDFSRLLEKFKKPRPALRSLNLLLFDHIGGLNTLLHALSNLCFLVLPDQPTPNHVCALVERYQLELLPATPTFLNMLLISRAYESHNLNSLKIITYGAEPMPESTLARLRQTFPHVEFRQTYGMAELGVLRAKSMASDSLWVKIGGEGYDIRVIDGILQIKADAAMLGYLNAPSPFTEDGYFITGDRVEVKGEYLRILGRDSDLINVGGQKVFPSEVEAVILECEGVADVVVYGEKHPFTGKIVCADVKILPGFDPEETWLPIKKLCNRKLQPFMVPVKVNFIDGDFHTGRMKRVRHR